MTFAEALVYAAAFGALDRSAVGALAKRRAYVAVIVLRGEERILDGGIDPELVEHMYGAFCNFNPTR